MEKKIPLHLLLKTRRKMEEDDHLVQIGHLLSQMTLIEDQGILNFTIVTNVVTMPETIQEQICPRSDRSYNNNRYNDRRRSDDGRRSDDRRRSDNRRRWDDRRGRDDRRRRNTLDDSEESPCPQKKESRNFMYESNVTTSQSKYIFISPFFGSSPPDSYNSWLVDGRASRHLSGHKEFLSNLVEKETSSKIILGDNTSYLVKDFGIVKFDLGYG